MPLHPCRDLRPWLYAGETSTLRSQAKKPLSKPREHERSDRRPGDDGGVTLGTVAAMSRQEKFAVAGETRCSPRREGRNAHHFQECCCAGSDWKRANAVEQTGKNLLRRIAVGAVTTNAVCAGPCRARRRARRRSCSSPGRSRRKPFSGSARAGATRPCP